MTVTFTFTVPGATADTHYTWDFGDGATWNGSGSGFAGPSHLYSYSGTYWVSAQSSTGGSASSCILPVTVGPAVFAAAIGATPSSGYAPLNVSFTARVTGGSGTYVTFNWTFGDGTAGAGPECNHTFSEAGQYNVSLSVTDSRGSLVQTRLLLTVANTSMKDGPIGPDTSVSPVEGWIVIAAVVALSGGLALSLARYRSATRALSASLASSQAGPDSASATKPEILPPPLVAAGAAPQAPAVTRVGGSPPMALAEVVQVSKRIIRHLAQAGQLHPDEVGAPQFTQAGLESALDVSRSSVSNALRRLETAGIVRHDVRHVRGVDRRVRVYTLTDRGLALARDLGRPPRSRT